MDIEAVKKISKELELKNLIKLYDMIDAHRTPVMGTFDFWQEFDWKMQMHEGVKKCRHK